MKNQILNRIIKASYYAPNGFQLRKACLDFNSRNASRKSRNRDLRNVSIMQGLKENSRRDRKKLEPYGLKELVEYIQQNIDISELAERISNLNPEIKEKVQDKINTPEEAIKVASTIAKTKTYEEILSFLDMPISKIELGIHLNEPRIRIDSIAAAIAGFYTMLYQHKSIAVQILLVILSKTIAYGTISLTYYFFGNFDNWLNKNYGRILGFIFTLPLKILSLILRKFGQLLDKSNLLKQTKIAMKSPEFKNVYYKLDYNSYT